MGDLWSILLLMADSREGDTEVCKVRSHVLEKDREGVAGGRHRKSLVVGNELADAAADAGHGIFGGNEAENSRKLQHWEDVAYKVSLRNARIQARIWEKRAGARIYLPPPAPTMDTTREDKLQVIGNLVNEVSGKGHRLIRRNGALFCERCRVTKGWRSREYWTVNVCHPIINATALVKRARLAAEITFDV